MTLDTDPAFLTPAQAALAQESETLARMMASSGVAGEHIDDRQIAFATICVMTALIKERNHG